jgi:hypothetical protein
MKVPKQRLRASSDSRVIVQVDLPAGYHLNPSAPQRFRASIESGTEHFVFKSPGAAGGKTLSETSRALRLPLTLPLRTLAAGNGKLRIQLTLFYCREDNTGSCQIRTLAWTAPVEIVNEPEAANEIKVQARIQVDP